MQKPSTFGCEMMNFSAKATIADDDENAQSEMAFFCKCGKCHCVVCTFHQQFEVHTEHIKKFTFAYMEGIWLR